MLDIACTKLITVSARGSKKDFIDLFVLLEDFSLEQLFLKLDEKYEGVKYNHAHILKSLLHFEDAEQQPSPRMHRELSWDEVKRGIIQKVKKYGF